MPDASAMLVLANGDEQGTLIDWIYREGANPDGSEISVNDWSDAARWLSSLVPEYWPAFIPIPARFVDAIETVVDDWLEVLSNDEDEEDFGSYVLRAQE